MRWIPRIPRIWQGVGRLGRASAREPAWPEARGRRIVFLLDASSGLERGLLHDWLRRARPPGTRPGDVEAIDLPPSRRPRRWRGPRISPLLSDVLAAPDDPLLVPLRVVWLAPSRGGSRAVRLDDLLTLGDPRDPGRVRQAWVLRLHPDRCRMLAGEPAPVSELRRRWREAGGTDVHLIAGLAEFVCRQAAFALERAERRLRGARYKVPRFVREEILARPGFRGDLAALARRLERSEKSVLREAERDLREIAATHSTFMIDLVAHLNRRLYTRGYGEALHYDREELRGLYALAQRHPVVFLPTHKSHLDHMVLAHALHENGLPPNHTAAGANLNIPPLASLFRRSGVFFIRRSFKDDPVYKHVLESYIDYLVEKRFSLEWYIEGTRSRSGKLLPPRLGLLTYVADAYERGRSEDVFLIPVSIAYDQIQGIHAYVAEQRGAAKPKERTATFFRMLRGRGLHQQFGDVHIRFGEPLSLRSRLGPPGALGEPESPERMRAVESMAREVAVRIERVTPLTPTALVTLALLDDDRRNAAPQEIAAAVEELLQYARQRKLPTTGGCEGLQAPAALSRTLEALVENGVVERHETDRATRYAVAPGQELTAAYYRNTIVHFFVNGAIAELALARAAEARGPGADAALWEEVLRLGALLRFEFFLPEDEEGLRRELRSELGFREPGWEARLGPEGEGSAALVREMRPRLGGRVLRPFLESMGVAASVLRAQGPGAAFEERPFLEACLRAGREALGRGRIRSRVSVSTVHYHGALQLLEARGLLDPAAGDAPDLDARREAFAREIGEELARLDLLDRLQGESGARAPGASTGGETGT